MAGRNLRGAAAALNSFPPNQRANMLGIAGFLGLAYTTVKQDITASTVMQDTQLAVSMQPGYWLLEVNAGILISNAAQNIKYTFNAPDGLAINLTGGAAGVTIGRGFLGINGVATQEDSWFNLNTAIIGGATNAWTSLRVAWGMQVTQAGTLMFQFAQNASGAPATSLLGGATMRAMRFADQLGN